MLVTYGATNGIDAVCAAGCRDQNANENKMKAGWQPLFQLARWMSPRIDRAAQMKSSAPTVLVTAADSSE